MKRYGVVLVSTLVGVAAIAAAGAASAGFGSQSSVRSFAHLAKRMGPSTTGTTAVRPASSAGSTSSAAAASATGTRTTRSSSRGSPASRTTTRSSATTRPTPSRRWRRCRASRRRAAERGDTAAYWVPTLISASGTMIMPRAATVYYRRHTLAPVQAFPPGFRLIAGNSKATSPQGLKVTYWNCGPHGGVRPQSTIPTCPDARTHGLALHVEFPDCWDGVNLDTPDHRATWPTRCAAAARPTIRSPCRRSR